MNREKIGVHILRVGLALTILWFGIVQLINPDNWVGFLPGWAIESAIIEIEFFVYANGIFEIVTSLLLLFNQFSRIMSLLLGIHLAVIILHLGFNSIAVRDFGLLAGFVALYFLEENRSLFNNKRSFHS